MKQNLLSHFFDNPSMWFWALVMIAVMSVAVVHLSEIYVSSNGMHTSVTDFTDLTTDINGDTIPLLDRYLGFHLMPFGINFVARDALLGQKIHFTIQSDSTAGILILAICIIGIVIVTKRSSNALSVLGPFWIYSIVSLSLGVIELNRSGMGEVKLSDFGVSCILSLVITSTIVGLICRTAMQYAVNMGWISGVDSYSDESVQINPEIISQVNRVAGQVTQAAGNILESGSAWASGKLVGRNIRCCPFCGTSDFTFVKPHPYGSECKICGHAVGVLEEQTSPEHKCPVCTTGFVKGAKFCHRCGTLLENYRVEPIQNGNSQSNNTFDYYERPLEFTNKVNN